MPPHWNPGRFHGHINERQAIFIGAACVAIAMLFSVGVVVWVCYGVAHFFGFL